MPESSKASSKADKKQRRKSAVEAEPAASSAPEPSPKALKRKKSTDVAEAGKDESEKPLKRKKAKKESEAAVAQPVEGKKKKSAKGAETVDLKAADAAPEGKVSKKQAAVEEEAPPKTKTKKSKAKATAAPVPEPLAETPPTPPAGTPKVKKSKKSKAPSPSPEPPAAEAEDDSEEEEPLHGFSTDDDDSSDDDGVMDVDVSTFDVAKLPTIAKDDATVKRKLEQAKRQPTGDRGVLFLGRIPHGFYEDQLKAYFAQFGTVTRLRLSRNKKTGESKHYGFLEFDSSSVAQIVAETMDNYLLMGHILRCKVIPKDQVHPELWVGANRKWRPVPKVRVAQADHNKLRTKEEQLRVTNRLLKRQQERQRRLEKEGIKYDFGAAGYKKSKPSATE
ncbi:hypothetical protein B0H10DRAFT_2072112 [Mycena sp. CBHHK59/15]|nr:hypothetical protein B0H10DRAFT_2072112 [Mycena sp. CBHHK59/15]